MWDHICPGCQQTTPVYVHTYEVSQEKLVFGYLCETCGQKKLAEWLRCTDRTDYRLFEHITDFDEAAAYHNPQNDEDTLLITRWGSEQRRRRLQADNLDEQLS
jgi:protein-arginine kinase activator protein McsA